MKSFSLPLNACHANILDLERSVWLPEIHHSAVGNPKKPLQQNREMLLNYEGINIPTQPTKQPVSKVALQVNCAIVPKGGFLAVWAQGFLRHRTQSVFIQTEHRLPWKHIIHSFRWQGKMWIWGIGTLVYYQLYYLIPTPHSCYDKSGCFDSTLRLLQPLTISTTF